MSDVFTCKLGVEGDEMGRLDGFTYYLEGGLEVFLGDIHGTKRSARVAARQQIDAADAVYRQSTSQQSSQLGCAVLAHEPTN